MSLGQWAFACVLVVAVFIAVTQAIVVGLLVGRVI